VTEERAQAERFAELFRADDLIAGLRTLVDLAAPVPDKAQEDLT